ncbi:hypothetical protein LCGC14_1586010 [marine sediment metagenome]|uniref:Uncharacterized protein n=1 Tax=marine sediment metagenome TaxID=412755 RepID=A0A0F9IFE1_9ZZZZ
MFCSWIGSRGLFRVEWNILDGNVAAGMLRSVQFGLVMSRKG